MINKTTTNLLKENAITYIACHSRECFQKGTQVAYA